MTLIAYADGADSPRTAPAVVNGMSGEPGPEQVLLGWTLDDRSWLGSDELRGWTVMAGYALSGPVNDGRLAYVPIRLSAVPRLLNDTLVPDVAVVTAVRRGSELVFASSVGWGPALARSARSVIVEIDEDGGRSRRSAGAGPDRCHCRQTSVDAARTRSPPTR